MHGFHDVSIKAGARLLLICGLLAALGGCRSDSADTLLAQARQYEQQGDHKAAMIQLKNALQKAPDNAEARLALAVAHNALGDGAAAEKEARRAAQLGVPVARTVPVLARALLLQGQHQQVLDELDRSGLQDATSLVLRGDALLALHRAADAQQAYAKALSLNPVHVDAMLGMARYHFMQNEFDEAGKLADAAVRVVPNNVDAWLIKGELASAQRDIPSAIAAYDRVIAIAPSTVLARLQKAQLLTGRKEYEAAQAELTKAAQTAPGNPGVLYVQGLLDFERGRYAQARDAAQAALRVNPDHWPTVLLAGTVQLKLGSLPQAEEHLRRYVTEMPGNANARRLLAAALIDSGQSREALTILAPVLKRDDDAAAFALAGTAAMMLKERDEATAYLERAVALDPKLAGGHRSLGLSLLAAGQRERGLAALETARRTDPGGVSGVVLALAALRMGDFDKVLSTTAAPTSGKGDDKPALLQLAGQAYLGKHQPAEARASFERAVALAPHYFPAVASLAGMDMRAKDTAAARKRLTAYVSAYPKSIPAMNAMADVAAAEGRMDEVTQWLEKAREAQPDAVPPAIALAAQYLRTGQQRKALTLMRNAQTAHPGNVDSLDMLGQVQLAAGDTAAALESYDRLVSLVPAVPLAHLRLAAVHVVMKNDAAAESALKKALQLQPDQLEAQIMLLQILKRQGRTEQMAALLRQMQGQKTNAVAGHMAEGDWMAERKQYARALAAYEKAFALERTPELVIRQYKILAAQGNEREGLQRLVAWQKDHPDDIPVRAYLAQVYAGSGQPALAIAQWESLLKQVPPSAGILHNLARAYFQQNDPRALATAEHAYKLDSKNAAVADTLGWILVNRGQLPRGIALLKQAVAVATAPPEARYHLAYAFKQTGDKPQAREQLNTLIAAHKEIDSDPRIRTLLAELN